MRVAFLIAALPVFLSPGVFAQTAVELSTAARVAAGEPVRLGDIATVTGPEAAALSDIVLAAGATGAGAQRGWVEIDLDAVRAALDGAGVNWGRTTLSGSACAVRFAAGGAGPGTRPRAQSEPASQAAEVVDLSGPATVRTYTATSLARLYGVANEDLRLTFDAKDRAFLDAPAEGRRIDIQPGATSASSVVPVRIFIFSGDRLVSSATVSVKVLVRRPVVAASSTIERSRTISADQLAVSRQWLSPGAAPSCTAEEAEGAIARTRIGAGRVITRDMVEAAIVVKRGDIVDVNCLSGRVRVAMKARALKDGRDGEQVPFCIDGSKKPFTARMSGGHAVVEVAPERGPGAEPTTDQPETRP